MRHFLSVVVVFAIFTGGAAAREEPTRVLDIVWEEVTKERFLKIELNFTPERIMYDPHGNLVVHGTVVNGSRFTVDKVAVACTARNRDGSVVASTYSYTNPRRLRPAQRSSITIVFARHGRNIDLINYTLNGQWPLDANDRPEVGDGWHWLPDAATPTMPNPYATPGVAYPTN